MVALVTNVLRPVLIPGAMKFLMHLFLITQLLLSMRSQAIIGRLFTLTSTAPQVGGGDMPWLPSKEDKMPYWEHLKNISFICSEEF
jgi:hypothetical protein